MDVVYVGAGGPPPHTPKLTFHIELAHRDNIPQHRLHYRPLPWPYSKIHGSIIKLSDKIVYTPA